MANQAPVRMRTIGILGGMSNAATAEYYRLINEAVNARLGGWNTAEVIVSSVNFGNIEYFIRNQLWDEAGEYLAGKAEGLERAGADFILCMSNTMHRVADAVVNRIGVPFLHIVDPTGEAIQAQGLKRVALLGTKPTMSATFIRDRYRARFGVDVIVPSEDEQRAVDRIIFDELVRNIVKPGSKKVYVDTVERLRGQGVEGVILGCTEIFFLIDQPDFPGFPVFDTTALHVKAAVDKALA